MSMPTSRTTSSRTTLRRLPERGDHRPATVRAILDEALVAHVGFAVDGQPWVIPMTYARIDDDLYLHGSAANHLLRSLAGGVEVCVTVTLLDGLVLARSAFHHSMNYRSVVIFGVAGRVDDEAEKHRAFTALVERMAPGRSNAGVRLPSPAESRKTLVVRLPIRDASAKIRTGPPIDDAGDLDLPVWAGVIPLRLTPGAPVPA
jgi:nitroimidazol reductase NimA-like FMN-containing flavoprotein (pyridoxamine 5'-phosphate oxidase superfamily)